MKKAIQRLLEKMGIRINYINNLWYLDSFFLLKKLNSNSRPVIFDVGACDGTTIIDFKNLFPHSTIYSFEPFPDSYANLLKIEKKYSDVLAYNLALSNTDGFMDFFVNKSKATNSLLEPKITSSFVDDHAIVESKIKVSVKMLDTFLAENKIEKIDILKVDVQGSELMVFEGAKNALESKRVKMIYTEVWFIEAYDGQPLFHDIASYLTPFGYCPFGIYNMHYRKDGHFLWGDAIFYLK